MLKTITGCEPAVLEEARQDDKGAAAGAFNDPAPPTVHGETSVCVQLAAFLGTCF
jgi:hypothetical protein